MIKFKVKLSGLDKGEKLATDGLKRVLMKSMFKMEELAIHKAPFDRGFLRQNISVMPQVLSDKYVLTSSAPYSAAMEYGTRPFYAPITPLTGWAGRQLSDKSLGWAIQAKIAKYGITAQPFMRPALWEVRDVWIEKFKNAEFGE